MKLLKVKIFLNMIFLLIIMIGQGCVGEGGRKGRKKIAAFKDAPKTDASVTRCNNDFFLLDPGDSCVSACPNGTIQATANEIDEIKETASAEIIANIDESAGVCISDAPKVTRPTKQVFIKNTRCSCLEGKSDIIGTCDSFCASKTVAVPTLFASVTLGADVELNSALGNLYNWCRAEIPGDDKKNPRCVLQATDGTEIKNIEVTIPVGSNSFTANLSELSINQTYILKLVEIASGSNAESVEFQIRRKDPDVTNSIDGPLMIRQISQYSCIERSYISNSDTNPNDITITGTRKRHFYFPVGEQPIPIPPNNPQVKCHDIILHGEDDSGSFERLEIIPLALGAWDVNDIRFADQNGNDIPDISDEIRTRLAQKGVTQPIDIFRPLIFPKRPDSGISNDPSDIQNANSGIIGVVMQPFIISGDGASSTSICPKKIHYDSSDPLFNILGDIIGVDTEGLYFALKEFEATATGSNTVTQSLDILLIRENLLKRIWFYTENNQKIVPNNTTAGQKTIQFHYPPDINNPLVKQGHQTLYTIRKASEITNTPAPTQSNGLPSQATPSDKRFGCIPALD